MSNVISSKEVENFWDNRPCNVKHSSKEIGSKEYFDEVEMKKIFVEPHILSFSDFESWRGKKVLEIGCGIGTMSVNFAKHGADYTGVELSLKSLELAKKRFEVYGLKGSFFHVNAEELSSIVPIESYDLIYSFGVIHHTPNPEKVIKEIQKYMNNKSVLKIMLYASNSWKNCMIESGLDQPEAQYGCPIANTYSKEDVHKLLNPLKITSILQDHIFPYQVEPYKNGQYIKEPWFETMPIEMFRALEKKFGWHLNITATL